MSGLPVDPPVLASASERLVMTPSSETERAEQPFGSTGLFSRRKTAAADHAPNMLLNRTVLDSLFPISLGLAIAYALLAVVLGIGVQEQPGPTLATLAGGSSMGLFVLAGFVKGRRLPTQWAQPLVAGGALVVLANSLAHLRVLPSTGPTVSVAVLLFATGFVLLSHRWLAIVIVTGVAGWGVAAWQIVPALQWLGSLLTLCAAAGLSLLVHAARIRTYRKLQQACQRERDEVAGWASSFDTLPGYIAILDQTGAILAVNDAWRRFTEATGFFGEHCAVGMNYVAVCESGLREGSEQAQRLASEVREILGRKRDQCTLEYACPSSSQKRWFRVRIRRQEITGPLRLVVAHEEITPLKEAEHEARIGRERCALLFLAANDGLWDWDLETNKIYFSTRWKAMLGFAEHEIGDRPDEWLERVHTKDVANLLAKMSDHLEGRSHDLDENEHRVLHRDGDYRWVSVRAIAVRNEEGKAIRLVGAHTDLTAQRQAKSQLLHEALHDTLTGLPNRNHLRWRLQQAAVDADPRLNRLFALLYIDLDRFKLVNDSLGHTVGDQLLVDMSERLKSCIRPDDCIARLGGDEFAVLLQDLRSVQDATDAARRIQTEITRPFHVGNQEVFTAASIGIAIGTLGDEKPGVMLRNADTALHRAKALGRSRYEVFDQNMHAHAVQRLDLEMALRQAVERDELLVHYQPIVTLSSGQITRCEALIRWRHPKRGLISPAEFIPIAEESDLIDSITDWILRTACHEAAAWQTLARPPVSVAVNIPPRQFHKRSLVEVVDKILVETGLSSELLQLELTESELLESADSITPPLVDLTKRGIKMSLDDFGTGHSSLTRLQQLPIHHLKIDESLVRHMTTNSSDAAITTGIIRLAHTLGLEVTVEGVETHEQLEFLVDKECDEVQGLIVSPPLAAEDFRQLLKETPQIVLLPNA